MKSLSVELRSIVLLAIGALTFSSSSLLVRLAFPISTFEVTFWRLFFGAIFVSIVASFRGEFKGWSHNIRSYWPCSLAMSLHFLFFVTALWFTSIAHALSIVYLSPAVIAIVSTQIFHERLSRVQIMGITLSIVGIAVMLGFELEISREKLVGDFFALLSGLMFAAYSILGRIHRRYISAFAYTSRIYSLASILALPMLIFSFEVANYSFDRIAALALAGIVPIGIGHTLYNTALKYLSATKVNLMASQEVTGGILLGGLFLAEIPSVTTIAGVILNLIGISLVLLQRRPTSLQDTRVSRDSD